MPAKINTTDLPKLDMAEQLRTEQDIAEYITMVLNNGDTDELIRAMSLLPRPVA